MLSSLRSSQGQQVGPVYPNLPSQVYQQNYQQYTSYNPYASTSSQPSQQNALQPYAGGQPQQQQQYPQQQMQQYRPFASTSGAPQQQQQMQAYGQPGYPQQVQAYQGGQQGQQGQQGQHVQSYGQPQTQQRQQQQQQVQAGAPSYSYASGQMQGQGASTGPTTSWRTQPSYAVMGPPTQLQPQQLETVSRDEDPVYGPLKRARGKVERAIVADNEISPDLADMLQSSNGEPYAPLPNSSYKPLRITGNTPLPDALLQQLNEKGQSAKMGLFEDIERAWFTIDKKLFLWDYSDGRDFSRFDEQNDRIEAVGLVRARKDVFVDDITHILIICTASKATILGLSRPNPREISLYATNLSTELPSPIESIQGTDAGRIFMVGANKDLFELEYSSSSSWIFGSSTRVTLHNRTSSALSNWVPSMFSSNNKEGVESIAVDAVQGRLYALYTRGEIEYFDVSGVNFVSRGKYSRLRADLAAKAMPPQPGQPKDDSGTKIVAIAAVGGHESRRACVVAIAANGTRVYFSTGFNFSPIAFRQAPGNGMKLDETSFYSSGTFIGVQKNADSGATPQTHLTYIIPNPGRTSSARENFENFEPPVLSEWAFSEALPTQVWTIVEVPTTDPAYSPAGLKRNDGVALSALPRQSVAAERQFLALATSGLFFLSQPRPVDILQGDLEADKDAAINASRATYGKTQLAAMGVMLGATAPDTKQADLASALSTIMLSAGSPLVRDSTAGRTITYSPRHDGLALMLARYLRSIWSTRVVYIPASPLGRAMLGVPDATLLKARSRLEALKRYISDQPFPRQHAEGDAKVAWDQEELSLHGLQILLSQSIEALSFLMLLSDYKLADIIAKCDPQLKQVLAELTFADLFTGTNGRDVAKKLVTVLIEQQIGQQIGIDTLSEILQQRCGSFVQPGDVVLYKAEENIRRAEQARSAAEKQEGLTESLKLFTKASSSISIPRVKEICDRYRSLGFTRGAIELALQCASDLDPQDKASDFVRDGEHLSDPRKALYESRMECYQCVVETLAVLDQDLDRATAQGDAGAATSKRDEAYSLAIASDDELFHFYLYDWHVSRHLSEQLLEFDTPYIERYLQMTSNTVEDRRDLLWKFYARREEYLPAAQALYDLATRPSSMQLPDRVYYLAQALTSAKSAASLGAEDVDFMSNLQERMDVANVQMEVLRALDGVSAEEVGQKEKDSAITGLSSELLGLDELYQSFARPFRLYESILLILKTADTRIDDVVEAVWRQLVRQSAVDGSAAGVGEASVAAAVRDLCRRFYPSEAAPLDIVLPVVYSEASELSGSAGWASVALSDGGIPLRDLWEGVMALYEETGESEFYAEEAATLAHRWLDDRDAIPAAEVERFASAWLLRSQSAGKNGADERRRATKDKLSAAKAAAARY